MIDLQRIRENPEAVRQAAIFKKNPADIDGIINLDAQRREIIKQVEEMKNLRNKRSPEIAALKKTKREAEAAALLEEMKGVSDRIKELDAQQAGIEKRIHALMEWVSNVAHSSVPHGQGAQDNVVVASWGAPKAFDFAPKDHLQLGTALDIIDFGRGAKVAGAGFPVYKGRGALLERSLINFMLDTHVYANG
jgi:seryl-tRNA synthetase